MQLLRKLAPLAVETQVTSPTFSVPPRVGNIMDASGIPLVGALGSISLDERSLTLLVINRSLEARMTTTIHLMDYTPSQPPGFLESQPPG